MLIIIKLVIRLPENIIFTDNQNFSFSSNVHFNQADTSQLSMFDVLINEYRIVPLLTGDTAINNFIIDSSLNPDINDSIYYESIITKNSFYNQLFCNTHIILNIINTKPYNSNKIIFKGILYESSPKSLNFNINLILVYLQLVL